MKIVSVSEMSTLEKAANNGGISYEAMMSRAGNGIAVWLKRNLSLRQGVVGLVGSGNNGGDTIIALTNLALHNVRTFAFLVKQRPADPLLATYTKAGGTIIDLSKGDNLPLLKVLLEQEAIVLDGMLGTGFRLPLRGSLADLMAGIHATIDSLPGARIIAVDCPSGVDCDTGEVSEETLQAETTLTMAAVKQGLLKYPARGFAGNIHLIEIGIPLEELTKGRNLPELIDQVMINKLTPDRPEAGHKGTFGTCVVIAGTEPFTGAAYLAGKAAYQSGCGLVNVATLHPVREALAGKLIEAVWTVLPEQEGGYDPGGIDLIAPLFNKTNSVVIGPGFGLGKSNISFIESLLHVIPSEFPILLDADGIKLLSHIKDWWKLIPKNTVLTPHPGEMSVLTGISIANIEKNRWEITSEYAQMWGASLVLKGAMTVIGLPDGQIYINPVGDSALATAGSGDVLSGIIGGLMAQGMSSEKAALLGVWRHAKAGQSAHQEIGRAEGVTALDILDNVGKYKEN